MILQYYNIINFWMAVKILYTDSTFLFNVTTVFVRPLISFCMPENLVSMADIWSLSVRICELSVGDCGWSMVLCSLSSRWENWELCSRRKWFVKDWKFPDFSQSAIYKYSGYWTFIKIFRRKILTFVKKFHILTFSPPETVLTCTAVRPDFHV